MVSFVTEYYYLLIIDHAFGLKSTMLIYETGHFCPAIAKAVKTMKRGEKVLLTVKPQCEFFFSW